MKAIFVPRKARHAFRRERVGALKMIFCLLWRLGQY